MDRMELEEIERRSSGYWNIDGLPELVMGALWVVWGGLWLIGTTLPRGSMAFTCFWLVVPPTLACSGLFSRHAIQRLKERISYSRAGYVRAKEPADWVRWAVAVLVTVAMTGVVFLGFVKDNTATLPPLVVAALSLWFLIMAIRTRAGHLVLLALASAGFGGWVWRTEAGWPGLNWAFLWLGAAALVTGALRLRGFLRENPKVAETEA